MPFTTAGLDQKPFPAVKFHALWFVLGPDEATVPTWNAGHDDADVCPLTAIGFNATIINIDRQSMLISDFVKTFFIFCVSVGEIFIKFLDNGIIYTFHQI